jgi:hypothetical protein
MHISYYYCYFIRQELVQSFQEIDQLAPYFRDIEVHPEILKLADSGQPLDQFTLSQVFHCEEKSDILRAKLFSASILANQLQRLSEQSDGAVKAEQSTKMTD